MNVSTFSEFVAKM